jgi:deoxyhypusine synthase
LAPRELHDGRDDGLEPIEPISLADVDSFTDLLRAMGKSAFAGRQLGAAFDVVLNMIGDSDCRVVLTISGAMTVAKQGRIICDLIDRGAVHVVVATGALLAHGLSESIGMVHYKYDPSMDDKSLYSDGYNRIYDTLELESSLNEVEEFVRSVMDTSKPDGGIWSSSTLCRELGRRLSEQNRGPGILRSAYEHDVPVYVPAFTDSELALDVAIAAMRKDLQENVSSRGAAIEDVFRSVPPFNPFLDLQQYARYAGNAKRLGIFTIGGGAPRNWAQQVAPYFETASIRLGLNFKKPIFTYGVRICPEPVHWGGLSGSTYSEGVSWGKFVPVSEGGRYAEVTADATVVLPLLIKAVFEELDRSEQQSE